jgi:hypothetical protein
MNRRAFGLMGGLATVLGALNAHAETLVFSEDWEGATPNTWATSKMCNAIQNTQGAAPGAAITPTVDAVACSGKIVSDPNLFSGGYMVLRKQTAPTVAPIPVLATERYCLSAWIRSPATAVQNGGFVSINYTPSVEGDYVGNYAGNGEHFIIGGEPDAIYGATPATLKDGKWHRYQKGWAVSAADAPAGVSTKMVLKTVNFVGGNGSTCTFPPTQGPAIDFDDIRVYKLAAGETLADLCPEGRDGMVHANPPLAKRADETQHETCAGTKAVCAKGANGTYACSGCDGSFGATTPGACKSATAPICTPAGDCKACAEDNGVMGAVSACAAATPYCKPDGSCGKCASDNDCKETSKNHGAGANKCETSKGSCTNGCTVPTEGADCENSSRPWCDVMAGSAVGICQEKIANGGDLPNRMADMDPTKGQCNDANAVRFCASAICDRADNKCGLATGSACTPTADDAKCRADICGADGKCGQSAGGACTKDSDCRAGTCQCSVAVAPGTDAGMPTGTVPSVGESGGCVTSAKTTGSSSFALIGLAAAASLVIRRRRQH